MIHRIVTMTFREDEIDSFLEVFDASQIYIKNFPGCLGLTLLQTTDKPFQ
ncbi:MAG: antibiotic biosynthesis monooxygenase, partial [Bacteroidetes bacterium]|nr:antibiotic biosynthesis monooxygenase [Bacteroidota bacterium]